MKYAIKRIKDGKFVALPGSKKSYTTSINNAQVFNTLEDAKMNSCGNEVAVKINN